MKKLLFIAGISMLAGCNSKKEKESTDTTTGTTTTAPEVTSTSSSNTRSMSDAAVTYTAEGSAAKTATGSILVQKDKDKLSPGNENLGIVTANSDGGESFVVNFLFALKPGVYPVVGLSLSRGKQVFGGILGGEPKMTEYKVNLTECTDLGSNNMGGNRWKLSGTMEGSVNIEAMSIMKMDTSHPANVKISNISFSNLTFDDNWEELLKKMTDKMRKD